MGAELRWYILDNEFNRAWYPGLVRTDGAGRPPSYAVLALIPRGRVNSSQALEEEKPSDGRNHIPDSG